ncbi:MAG: CBS domain-containing protein [Lacipirellulaceae bacterium]
MSFHLSLSADTVTAAYPDEPLLVSPETTIREVLQLMRTQRGGSVLVCDDSGVIGIYTERDALASISAAANGQEDSKLDRSVTEVMTASPVSVSTKTTVEEAITKMSEGGYRNLPVLSETNQPEGVIAVRGIVHYLVDHFPNTIYNLPPQPGRSPAEREGA